FLGEPVTAVLEDKRDGTIYAALRMGHFGPKFRRSRDGGKSWEDLAPPSFAGEVPTPDFSDPDFQAKAEARKKGVSVDTIWILTAGGEDQPGRIWAGTLPGGLFRSEDHGESWTLDE